jgi:hypothetical protein
VSDAEGGGYVPIPRLAASDIGTETAFVAWVEALFRQPPGTVTPTSPIARLCAGDSFAFFAFVAELERVVGEQFPADLVAVSEVVQDFYWVARVKASRTHAADTA